MATAPAATPERKVNPNAPKPKQNLLLIGGVLIILGLGGAGYERFRPRTKEELKSDKEEEAIEQEKIREAEKEAKRHQH